MRGNSRFPEFREAERVEIITLMDNSIDLSSTSPREEVKCFRDWVRGASRFPIAEHGFSMLIQVFDGNESHGILFDTGGSPSGVIMNAKRMGINLDKVEYIVLSHGHYDHFSGLPKVAKAINRSGLPIIVHGDMFRRRGTVSLSGAIRKHPDFPSEHKVRPAKYIEVKEPCLIADELALVTGEIPRITPFETGYPQHRAFIDGRWEPDPWIWDERALAIYVRRKGLVVVSGCSHAGIINTLLYVRQLTSMETVYAVLGGLHLAGKEFESRINQTVEELRKIKPRLIAPSHCTGWRAAHAILNAMPDSFVWGSVGNLYVM